MRGSDDLVLRLRRLGHPNTNEGRVAQEAARYIEELEAELAELRDAVPKRVQEWIGSGL